MQLSSHPRGTFGLLVGRMVLEKIEKKASIVTNIAASLCSEDELSLHEASFTNVSVHEISARKIPSDKRRKHPQYRAASESAIARIECHEEEVPVLLQI